MTAGTTVPVALEDIQALVHGFDQTWMPGRFYYLRIMDDTDPSSSSDARRLIRSLPQITSVRDLQSELPSVIWNIAFSHAGLTRVGLTPEVLETFPADFRRGMRRSAAANGDTERSAPINWAQYWQQDQVHVVLFVHATTDANLLSADDLLHELLASSPGLAVVGTQDVRRLVQTTDLELYVDDASTQANAGDIIEHFGFRDGISQPAYVGLDPSNIEGGGKHSQADGWQPLATGELLLGYADEAGELAPGPKPELLARNGTFMVLRKLRQHVDVWRAYLRSSANPKHGMSADELASRMIGRRRNGTPLAGTGDLNDFTYQDDPHGHLCPLASHARRANPRDSMGEDTLLVNRHRILRQAITYGAAVPRDRSEHEINGDSGQGLMFIALCASIERQFEFLQQQWINNGNDLNQGLDRDPLIGANGGDGQFIAPGYLDRRTTICSRLPNFVTTEGGEYLFLPGIQACRMIGRL